MTVLRVATYNVHKCRGIDWRVDAHRILNVLLGLHADVIAVQEIFEEQARLLAGGLRVEHRFAPARTLAGRGYGNAVFSRLPIELCEVYDLTVSGREARNCIRVDVRCAPDSIIHHFALHLGTSFFERRKQAIRLLSKDMLAGNSLTGPRIVMGDFNEWSRGLVTQSLSKLMESVDVHEHLGRRRTYPGTVPFLHLDHIYYDRPFRLHRLILHRTTESLLASDHLPLMAELELNV
ncbi:MAG: endonuclease/exonuclease/phosphatase family protein [Acidobacteriaceae bacterium]|nr:endonuclease/exonuclease/phosphatase family protein [Acidobacteriaceae bacterium]